MSSPERKIFDKVKSSVGSVQDKLYDILRPDIDPKRLENIAGWRTLIKGSVKGARVGVDLLLIGYASKLVFSSLNIPFILENPVLTIGGSSIIVTMSAAYPLIFHRPIPSAEKETL